MTEDDSSQIDQPQEETETTYDNWISTYILNSFEDVLLEKNGSTSAVIETRAGSAVSAIRTGPVNKPSDK
jgi:hypothetical protein